LAAADHLLWRSHSSVRTWVVSWMGTMTIVNEGQNRRVNGRGLRIRTSRTSGNST
jgi:hypothetical protein